MPLQLEIVSPERRAFTDEVDMVIVPGIDGQLGILPHHTRLITALGTGELRIKKGGTEQSLLISGGFVEVRPDKVIVMADLAEHSDEIDEARGTIRIVLLKTVVETVSYETVRRTLKQTSSSRG